jgi:hypothetical protein
MEMIPLYNLAQMIIFQKVMISIIRRSRWKLFSNRYPESPQYPVLSTTERPFKVAPDFSMSIQDEN